MSIHLIGYAANMFFFSAISFSINIVLGIALIPDLLVLLYSILMLQAVENCIKKRYRPHFVSEDDIGCQDKHCAKTVLPKDQYLYRVQAEKTIYSILLFGIINAGIGAIFAVGTGYLPGFVHAMSGLIMMILATGGTLMGTICMVAQSFHTNRRSIFLNVFGIPFVTMPVIFIIFAVKTFWF